MNMINSSELTLAIRRKDIHAHFQPIFHLHSGKFRAIEARVRWITGPQEVLTAKAAVTKAIEMQQEVALDILILQQAYEALVNLQRAQTPRFQCAVNVCESSVLSESFIEKAEEFLKERPLFKGSITLEIPISAFEKDMSKARHATLQLSKAGFSISLDHVTNVNQIKNAGRNLHILSIKLDESVVSRLIDEPSAVAEITDIVEQSHANRFLVVAEGIKKLEQFDALRKLDCDEGQGMLMCRPTPINGLSPLLNRGGCW
jgi:EAL domain-containing protein (putative c-di-GMP-specific phosphodiesterase class I)